MTTRTKKAGTDVRPAGLTLRIAATAHQELAGAAAAAGLPVARFARVLLLYGLAQLKKGNADLDRAIKVSRD